ncbi:MAG: hypothetical protein ACOYN3_02070 [Acidimicrobiia bacterium]
MRSTGAPGQNYLNLPRALGQGQRFSEALRAYDRAFIVLRGCGHGEVLVVGQMEAASVALELGDLHLAERYFSLARRDADEHQVSITPASVRLMELMLAIARGEEERVLGDIEEHLSEIRAGDPVPEVAALFQLLAKIYDRVNAPLRAASHLALRCQLLEEYAGTVRSEESGFEVAVAYLGLAQYLHTMFDACLNESAAEYCESPERQAAWNAFLGDFLHFDPGTSDLATAMRHEMLRALDASDWWGSSPNIREVRFNAGILRVFVLLQMEEVSAAAVEARRLLPIGEAVGAPAMVARLSSISELGGRAPGDEAFGR